MAQNKKRALAPVSVNPEDPLARDFRNFLYLVWKHLNLPDPTPVQYDIAKYLQHGPNKVCIEAFRGVGKSWVTSAYVLWLLYRNPQLKIMVVSASKNRADNFTTFTLRLIEEIEILHFLKPTSNQRCSRVEFDVGPARPDQTPSVFSRGIDSQLTGGRADIIISDDVEVVNNSATVEMRDKLVEKTKEYSAILKPLETSKIIYLGTPQTEDSIYAKLPSTFDIRIWPAQVPTEEEFPAYNGNLAPLVHKMYLEGKYGAPTDPDRFDLGDLYDRKAEYGAAGYQLQFMLNTRLSDEERFPLKLRNLVVMPVPPEEAPLKVQWLPHPERVLKKLPNMGMAGDQIYAPATHSDQFQGYTGRVLAIDPSGRGSDETGYAVGFHLAGNIWVPEAGGMAGGFEEDTLERLADIAARHKVHEVIVEANFGDGMFAKLLEPVLRRKHSCVIEEVKHYGAMKERRIVDTLEPVISAHRLIVDPEVIKADHASVQRYEALQRNSRSLMFQMTHICREKGALRHDDRLDALSILVARFVEIMNQDADEIEKEQRERTYQEFLDRHLESIGGLRTGPKSSWNSRF